MVVDVAENTDDAWLRRGFQPRSDVFHIPVDHIILHRQSPRLMPIQKPYASDALYSAVREVLDQR